MAPEKPRDAQFEGARVALRPRRIRPAERFQLGLDAALAAAVLASIPALMLDVGFAPAQRLAPTAWLRGLQTALAATMALERLARLAVNAPRREYLLRHWGEYLAAGLLPIAALAGPWLLGGVVAADRAAALAVQLFLLTMLIARGLRLADGLLSAGEHPARLVAISFVLLTLFGSALLMLPRSVPAGHRPVYFIDALFTSTSAACVTGLIVRDTGSDFSQFGQAVILCLIQLGGLGIMIFGSVFVLMTRRGIGVKHAAAMGEMLSQENLGQVARVVRFIVAFTFAAELVGAILLLPMFAGEPRAGFKAVFHSISAFCNAGFALQADSFIGYRRHWGVLAVVPVLIILGGVGFPVLQDVIRWCGGQVRMAWARRRSRPTGPRPRLSLHSKLTLWMTAALLLAGAAVLLAIEPTGAGDRVGQPKLDGGVARLNDWQAMAPADRLAQAWFTSVTARTAGFNTIEMDDLTPAGKLWVAMLMYVGGSPASTAGGVKTVTIAVLLLLVAAMLRRRQDVEAHGRSISTEIVRRAVTIAVLYTLLVAATTLALCVTQASGTIRFMDVMFEAFSACGTVGLSVGETARLTDPSKAVVILAMLAGRVGPLTILAGLMAGLQSERYSYPSESVMTG